MVIPLLPFYAKDMGGGGLWVGVLVSAFSLAQLISAPLWGRVSDRHGRRPALLIGLGAAAISYVVFAFAQNLWILLLSRLVQGAGGGTVGVLQAYIADATEPQDRAKSLGWLSAATNAGVAIGPVMGSTSMQLGSQAPGLLAAGLCVINMVFAWAFLAETNTHRKLDAALPPPVRGREMTARVLSHPTDPAPRLIWIYAIGMAAFAGFTSTLALFLADRFGVMVPVLIGSAETGEGVHERLERRARGRERILGTAYELFSHRGIHDVGINEVVERAGVPGGDDEDASTSFRELMKEIAKDNGGVFAESWLYDPAADASRGFTSRACSSRIRWRVFATTSSSVRSFECKATVTGGDDALEAALTRDGAHSGHLVVFVRPRRLGHGPDEVDVREVAHAEPRPHRGGLRRQDHGAVRPQNLPGVRRRRGRP